MAAVAKYEFKKKISTTPPPPPPPPPPPTATVIFSIFSGSDGIQDHISSTLSNVVKITCNNRTSN